MEHQHSDLLRKILHDKSNPVEESPEKEDGFDLQSAGPLELQQMIGNRATQSLLSTSGADSSHGSKFIQTKLTVTAADDAYEAEADAVAKDVVNNSAQRQASEEEEEMQMKRIQREEDDAMAGDDEDLLQGKRLQRQEEEEEMQMKRIQRAVEEEEPLQGKRLQRQEEEEMQMKRIQRASKVDMQDSFSVGGDVEEQIKNSSGGGQPISKDTRSELESGMGYDFSNVNIHQNSQSDALNRSLQARAFTYGNDIYFRQGEYNPGSTQGKELLAHELTHTVQQGAVSAKREDD